MSSFFSVSDQGPKEFNRSYFEELEFTDIGDLVDLGELTGNMFNPVNAKIGDVIRVECENGATIYCEVKAIDKGE